MAGKESEYMETLTDAEVLTALTDVIRRLTGIPSSAGTGRHMNYSWPELSEWTSDVGASLSRAPT